MLPGKFPSRVYGVDAVDQLVAAHGLLHIPEHVVMSPTRNQQYFCSDLIVAGRVLQEMGFHEKVAGKRCVDCVVLPFNPVEYRGNLGQLEMVLQSCEETVWQIGDVTSEQARVNSIRGSANVAFDISAVNCVGWCVFWDWSMPMPEYEFTHYTDSIYPE